MRHVFETVVFQIFTNQDSSQMSRILQISVVRCVIWYNFYNLKNVKNAHAGEFPLVNLRTKAFNFTKSNTLLCVFKGY